jgi:transcription termination/antitermination protein NusG
MLQGDSQSVDLWYVVHTRSRHEKIVRDDLTQKGIENYLPVFHQWREWKDRTKRVELPVFSGYVFAKFCDRPDIRVHVLRTPGAVRIIGNGGGIEPVPDSELEAVRRILGTGTECISHPFLRAGARVRVRRGPLKGVEGLLVAFKNRGRLVVSVNLLSQSVATEVNAADVEAIGSGSERFQNEEAVPLSYAEHNARCVAGR